MYSIPAKGIVNWYFRFSLLASLVSAAETICRVRKSARRVANAVVIKNSLLVIEKSIDKKLFLCD